MTRQRSRGPGGGVVNDGDGFRNVEPVEGALLRHAGGRVPGKAVVVCVTPNGGKHAQVDSRMLCGNKLRSDLGWRVDYDEDKVNCANCISVIEAVFDAFGEGD